jgi:hypothetical protein
VQQCYWGTQYALLLPLGLVVTAASACSWRLLFKTGVTERLGLRAEFRLLNTVGLSLITTIVVLTLLVDTGRIKAAPHGHRIISILWLLLLTSRFVIM